MNLMIDISILFDVCPDGHEYFNMVRGVELADVSESLTQLSASFVVEGLI